jgi:hydrogenase/urease accessory protein HupE
VVAAYFGLGVKHMLTGVDHLLFLLGLVLLARTRRALLATIGAFTIGHSLTLSLAVLQVIVLPAGPIEVAIASSVLVLAIELAREPSAPTLMRRHPWTMAGSFGLLHGLGFAAALRAAGLPAGEIPLALLAFNFGIELGQLVLVLPAILLRAMLAGRDVSIPRWAQQVPIYAMGSLAAFWCFARAAELVR